MTTQKAKAAADKPQFDPARRYAVQLSRIVEYPEGSGRYLSPGIETELRGDAAAALADAIGSATLVPEPPAAGSADEPV